jgi:hypothetical protein
MAQHVKILGILHIVFGALGVLGALAVLLIFGGVSALVASDHSADSATAIPILGLIGGFLFLFVMALSLPGLIIGIGLVQFRPWARIGGIIISGFDLLGFPFHTALGIYGLWILLNRDTERMFAAPAARAV